MTSKERFDAELEKMRSLAIKDSKKDKRSDVQYRVMRTGEGRFYMDQHYPGTHRSITGEIVIDTVAIRLNAKPVEVYVAGKLTA
jgi:hypothetical protein